MVAEAPAMPPVALEPLLAAPAVSQPARGGTLPEPLHRAYGGDLGLELRQDRPTVIANFVTSLDGVVSHNTPGANGGAEISGFFQPDRFVMGLLRALSDVVVIGAGTLRAGSGEAWTPASVHPESAEEFAALRGELGLSPQPTTVVVTASGAVDPTHPGLSDPSVPVLIVTTARGREELARREPAPHVEIRSIGSDRVEPKALVTLLAGRAAGLVLCEGGPHLFGQLLAAGLVDELFLTIAPQLAGRSRQTTRLSLVEGTAFGVADAPWGQLVDLRRSGSHLFTRYRFNSTKG